MIKYCINAFLFIILSFSLSGQYARFDRFNLSDGLAHNSVFSLEVDSIGYVWIGTPGGLNRFDGYNFELFKQDSIHANFKGNYVTALQTDIDGNIWFTTINGGLSKYIHNKKEFIHYSHPILDRFSMEEFNNIIVDNDSIVWIQYKTKVGLYNITRGTFIYKTMPNRVNGIIKDTRGQIIFGTNEGVFSIALSVDSFVCSQINCNPIHNLKSDSNITIAAVDFGIVRFNEQYQITDTLHLFNDLSESFDPSNINDIIFNNHELWMGTDKGLYYYVFEKTDEKDISTLVFKDIFIPNDRIVRLKYDGNNNVWIGTINRGLAFYSRTKNQFKHIKWIHKSYAYTEGINSTHIDPVRAICKTSKGDIWLGFGKSGLGIITPAGEQKYYPFYTDEDGSRRNFHFVQFIYEDSYGGIWIASWDNISYYNKFRDRIETLNYKYNWSWPYGSFTIKEFTPGKLTVTGDNHVGIIDLVNGTYDTLPSQHNEVYMWHSIREVLPDSFNNLWTVQNNNGLIKINLNTLWYTHITKKDNGLSDDKIYAINIRGDSLWIATNSGIDLYSISKDTVLARYTEANGLSSDIVYTLHWVNNYLWMSTSKGLSRLDTRTGLITTFLDNYYFSDNAFFCDSEGSVFYGGYQGVVQFNPKDIQDPGNSSKALLENFYLFNRKVRVSEKVNDIVVLKQSISNTKVLRLHHKQNSFSFVYNAFPFNYPNNQRFRYRLVNLQTDWVYPEQGNRTASYTTVAPGSYVFQVSVSSAKGIWSTPTELSVIIVPPYWKRIWFKTISILFLAFLIALFIRVRMAQINKINLILEKRVHEQTLELKQQNQQIKEISDKLHEADQSKLRFFTNISHEFRTPLTLILGHLESLKHKNEGRTTQVIRKNAIRLLNLVNQLIDIRKMDQDQLKLKINQFDLVVFTKDIIDSFMDMANRKELTLQFYTSLESLQVWLDIDKMEKIVYNLITNAIKYTMPGGNIIVEVSCEGEKIQLSIEDNGIGIEPHSIDKIFDRFYRSDDNSAGGHGIGLSLVRGLTEIQQGAITVESEIGKGSRFVVCFKNGKEHFKESDFGKTNSENRLLIDSYQPPHNELNISRDHKILVVEDNPEMKDYIAGLLYKNYMVKTAENGKEALDVLDNFVPDLIVSDIKMPVMDGITFCSKIRNNNGTSHIPIILLTAKTDIETRLESLVNEVDAFIEKPFDAKLFIANIKSILANREKMKSYLLTSSNSSEALEKVTFSKHDKAFWKKVNQVINDNYANVDFNTEMLSNAMNMSRTTLYRKFRSLTGINAAHHIRKFRLYKAAKLLLEKEMDVAQVSIAVGFKSLSQFRINFKQEFGKSPSDYQKGK